MSGMKDILGEMTLEEFEEKRNELLNDVNQAYEVFNIPCSTNTRRLYNIWLDVQGRELFKSKLAKYGEHILDTQVEECIQFMIESFMIWLEETI